jgi:hypothetical protein
LRVEEQLSAPRSLTLSFSLPGAAVAITACAEIVWRDAKGHLGLHFVSMPPDSSRALKQWLMARRNR